MLVSAKEMLDKAVEGHYAVGQFNINNLEWTKSILLTAEELKSPVILGVSEGAGKYMTGFKTVAAMVKAMMEELNITVPVALHLDHGTYEGCKKCIDAGFSSIMFDGSKYPIEENVEKTRELIAICREKGMSIEAEVGSIGGEEDGVIGRGECADPNECKMIADLGVDMLAAGIGNIHGKYPANTTYREDLDEIVELMVETVCAKRKTTRIAGSDFPHEVVRSRFLKLDSEHIRFVMDSLQKNTTEVRNMKQYLLAVLFNAPTTISNHYTAQVNHDMYAGGW